MRDQTARMLGLAVDTAPPRVVSEPTETKKKRPSDQEVLKHLRAMILAPPTAASLVTSEQAARAWRSTQSSFVAARGWRQYRGEWRDPVTRRTCPLAQAFEVERTRERKRIVAEETGESVAVDEVRSAMVWMGREQVTLQQAMDALAPIREEE